MSIKVIRGKIFDGNKTYEENDIIDGLSKEEEARLVKSEVAEYVGDSEAEQSDSLLGEDDKEAEKEVDGVAGATNMAINPDSLALNAEEYAKSSKIAK